MLPTSSTSPSAKSPRKFTRTFLLAASILIGYTVLANFTLLLNLEKNLARSLRRNATDIEEEVADLDSDGASPFGESNPVLRRPVTTWEVPRHSEPKKLPSREDQNLYLPRTRKVNTLQASAVATTISCAYSLPDSPRTVYGTWQELNATTSNISFRFLSAYIDERGKVGPTPLVRVLMTSNTRAPPPLLCLLWYENNPDPLRTNSSHVHLWVDQWGNYDNLTEAFLLNCPIIDRKNRDSRPHPTRVSLVVPENCEQPTNVLPIFYDRPRDKQEFAVCVKGLYFPDLDLSMRLVEWFETLRLLGAKKVFIYVDEVHPNISKVLEYYSAMSFVEVTPLVFPLGDGHPPGDITKSSFSVIQQKRKLEMVSLNDCVYRNLYSHDYIVVLDTDEIIMPLQDANWSIMMTRLVNRSRTQGYKFRNAYFMDEMISPGDDEEVDQLPEHQHMLRHVFRAVNFSNPESFVKSIMIADEVIVAHNHFPLKCFPQDGICRTQNVNETIARMQHYRRGCTHDISDCGVYRDHKVKDTALWKYKAVLLQRTKDRLRAIGLHS